MRYPYLISLMTWSYSRLTAFEKCPYGFLLTYIEPQPKEPQFFASYGSFIHDILAKSFTKKLAHWEMPSYYIAHFSESVDGEPPSARTFSNFLDQGYDAMKRDIPLPENANVIGVEQLVRFMVNGVRMKGFVDLILEVDGDIWIVDHKSHPLKPRSTRRKPTQTDQELDDYLRQLYLYSIPVEEMTGKRPKYLCFYCYRTGVFIKEPFSDAALESTKSWVVDTVERIKENDDWEPVLNPFACRYLCDVHKSCEYFELM